MGRILGTLMVLIGIANLLQVHRVYYFNYTPPKFYIAMGSVLMAIVMFNGAYDVWKKK